MYLKDKNFSQLTLSEKSEMNLGRGKLDLVLTVITKQNTKFNSAVYMLYIMG